MSHENNITEFFIDKKGKKVWYNEVGKIAEGPHSRYVKNNPSAHPRHLNKRYMKTFKTKSEAVKEAISISASYDKKPKKKKKKT
jgi:hypothetical protein